MLSMEEMVRGDVHVSGSAMVEALLSSRSRAKERDENPPFNTYYARIVGGENLTVLTKERSEQSAAWTFGNDLLIDGGLSPDTEIEVFAPDGTQHLFFLQPHDGEHVSVETPSERSERQKTAGVSSRRVRCITFE